MKTEKMRLKMRVAKVQREHYILIGEIGEISGKLKGTFYKSGNYPVVGDYVDMIYNPDGDSIIEKIKSKRIDVEDSSTQI